MSSTMGPGRGHRHVARRRAGETLNGSQQSRKRNRARRARGGVQRRRHRGARRLPRHHRAAGDRAAAADSRRGRDAIASSRTRWRSARPRARRSRRSTRSSPAPTAVVYTGKDPVAMAKALTTFAKTAPTMSIKAAVVQGRAVAARRRGRSGEPAGQAGAVRQAAVRAAGADAAARDGAVRRAARSDERAGGGGEEEARDKWRQPGVRRPRIRRLASNVEVDTVLRGANDNGRSDAAAGGGIHQGDLGARAVAARQDARVGARRVGGGGDADGDAGDGRRRAAAARRRSKRRPSSRSSSPTSAATRST